MKQLLYISLVVFCILLTTGCGTQRSVSPSFTDLNGEWEVVEMNGNALSLGERSPFLKLDMNQRIVSGFAGCNRLTGAIEYTPSQKNIIRFMKVAVTRMACMDMTVEDEFLKTIDKVVRFDSSDTVTPVGTLSLYGTDGSKILVLKRR